MIRRTRSSRQCILRRRPRRRPAEKVILINLIEGRFARISPGFRTLTCSSEENGGQENRVRVHFIRAPDTSSGAVIPGTVTATRPLCRVRLVVSM